MGNPYVGEVRLFGGTFAPVGWAACDGALLAIAQNTVLFTLIGTTYGGDGISTFALPDLRGRVPIHMGASAGTASYVIGQRGGVESVTLIAAQIPAHSHSVAADSSNATATSPTNAYFGNSSPANIYSSRTGNLKTMSPLQATGASLPHDNMQPFLGLTFIISLFGIFPSR